VRTTVSAIPLTGADCFLRAFDGEIRRHNRASHVSQLVLRLGPGFDTARFTKLVEEVAGAEPLLRAPILRPLGVGAPVYRTRAAGRCAPPPVIVHDAAGPRSEALPEVFSRRLNERVSCRRGELLRFDVVRHDSGAGGSDLAMSWLHMLFDGSGSERFVARLDECFRGARQPTDLPEPGEFEPPTRKGPSLAEVGARARTWQRWVQRFGERPTHSLAGPLSRAQQALGYDVLSLSERDSERAMARAKEQAGFLTPMLFFLAAAVRAHHAVYRSRGLDPGSYLVPLPVDVRPKGVAGAVFRTHVSLLWFQVAPECADDLGTLLEELKRQRLASIKAGHVENGLHAMRFARYAPMRLYTGLARRHLGGELCSFFFAWTGEFCAGLNRFLGAEVVDGFHVPPAPASPGSCLAMSMRGGRLNATHVRQEGVFTEPELDLFGASLRADLAG
jgi:hypothetical protein